MRTTVTLDSDVEHLIRDAMHRTRRSFKATLNEAVRNGLSGKGSRAGAEGPFEVKPQAMGLRAGIDPARLSEVGDDLEVAAFLSTTRRLATPGRDSR